MATTQEAIARLRMIFETQGADAAVAEMKKLETAETSLGTSSLNLDRAFAGLERRYSETARAAAEYERSMRTLNAAVAQNPALAERAAAVQQTIAARYQATMQAARQAAQAQTAYGQASQAIEAQAQGLAASTGLLGSTLSTLGRAGTVAAVGIGGLYLAFEKLDAGVTRTAQYARDISHFAEATGLTTSQVQGLNKEATRFGISTDELHAGLLKFTASFEEVRSGGGAMLDIIRKIDPELARQAVSAGNEAEALAIVGQALRAASNEFERASLRRAAFGKGASDLGLMVQGLDIGAVTDRYKDRGLSQAVIEDLKKLQSEVDARGANISNKIYASFGVPWLEGKNNILAYIETVLKIGPAMDAAKSKAGGELFAGMLGVLRSSSPLLAASIEAALDLAKATTKVDEETKNAVTDQERLADAFKQTAATTKAAPDPRGQVRFEMEAVAPGTDKRRLEAINSIKAAYPGLVAQDALRMANLEDQLRIAQAMPGVARMEAEEQARINQLLLEGKDLQTATMMAAKERAVAQAQINSGAQQSLQQLRDEYGVASAVGGAERMRAQAQATYNQLVRQGVDAQLAAKIAQQQMANTQAQINSQAQQQLFNLRNQAGVAAAVTGAEKIRAQEIATINSLLQQGVSLENATAVAAQERANAEAAVNANVERQIFSLQQSTQLINAQLADMQEQAGSAQKILGIHEMAVRVQQAYTNAIREGASAEEASALAAATYNNLLSQRAVQLEQARQAQQQQAQQERAAADKQADAEALQAQQAFNQRMGAAQTSSQQALGEQIKSLAEAGSQSAKEFLRMVQGTGALFFDQAMVMANIEKAKQEVANLPRHQRNVQALDELKSLQDQFRLGGAATDQEKAQIQYQITYEKLVKEGVAASTAQQIASQELANTMQELAKSVDANTTALQSQLDPIYTEGRAALRIGYYGEGSGGTQRIVTGTGYAANENVPAPGNASAQAGGSGNLIVINNNFAAGAVMGDRRTQYQAANAYGRAIASTGK